MSGAPSFFLPTPPPPSLPFLFSRHGWSPGYRGCWTIRGSSFVMETGRPFFFSPFPSSFSFFFLWRCSLGRVWKWETPRKGSGLRLELAHVLGRLSFLRPSLSFFPPPADVHERAEKKRTASVKGVEPCCRRSGMIFPPLPLSPPFFLFF